MTVRTLSDHTGVFFRNCLLVMTKRTLDYHYATSILTPLLYQGPTPSARKRRVACLTFSCHIEGIAKRPCKNMIRRHATWMLIHPRSATFVSGLCFNFGFRCGLRYAAAYVAGGLSGLPSSSEGAAVAGRPPYRFRSRGTRDPTVLPRFCLTSLGDTARSASGPYHFRSRGTRDPTKVSGRWRVLGAASRRAIASRKAVPADIKDQPYLPLQPYFHGERGKVYPISPPVSSGKCGSWKLREAARPEGSPHPLRLMGGAGG